MMFYVKVRTNFEKNLGVTGNIPRIDRPVLHIDCRFVVVCDMFEFRRFADLQCNR